MNKIEDVLLNGHVLFLLPPIVFVPCAHVHLCELLVKTLMSVGLCERVWNSVLNDKS